MNIANNSNNYEFYIFIYSNNTNKQIIHEYQHLYLDSFCSLYFYFFNHQFNFNVLLDSFFAADIVLGCVSNSECAGTEACVNARCTNPCNCGPNAKCHVANHYPSCVCQPGYSGNPQLGCSKRKFNKNKNQKSERIIL